MGKITSLEAIRDEGHWYFEDARWSSETRKCTFKWPSEQYPCAVGIHTDRITNPIRIEIRKWVEQNLDGTVIYSQVDHTYHKYYDRERTWDNSYQISNYWMVFYLEDEASELAFRLRFSNYIAEITKHHPRYPEDKEWCLATPAERLDMK